MIKRMCKTVIKSSSCLLRFFNLTNVPKSSRHRIQSCVFTCDTLTLSEISLSWKKQLKHEGCKFLQISFCYEFVSLSVLGTIPPGHFHSHQLLSYLCGPVNWTMYIWTFHVVRASPRWQLDSKLNLLMSDLQCN